MKKEVYNTVGITSTLLNEKILELKSCQEEKEKILKWIDELTVQNLLEENMKEIITKMDLSLQRYKKVVNDIKQINENI